MNSNTWAHQYWSTSKDLYQLCEVTGYRLEDVQGATDDWERERERERERKKSGNFMLSAWFDDYVYIYIYIYPHQVTLPARISLTLSLHSSQSFIALGGSFQLHPVSAQSCGKFLFCHPGHVYVKGSIEERPFWVRPCFSSSVPHVLFVLLGWFVRWEVSGRVGINRRTSLMSWSLLLKQCPACLVHLTWMVCEMGGKWPCRGP